MTQLKLDLEKDNIKLHIEISECDQECSKYIFDKVLELNALIPNNPPDNSKINELENYIAAAYKSLESDVSGLHNPVSEFEEEYVAKKEFKKSYNEAALTVDNDTAKVITDGNNDSNKKQLWYICPCGNKGKYYISPTRTYISCHKCKEKMMVRLANSLGPDYQDEYGNYYIAGEFKKTFKAKEEEEEFWAAYNNSVSI